MKKYLESSRAWALVCLTLICFGGVNAQPMGTDPMPASLQVDYKGSKVMLHGDPAGVSKDMLLKEAKLIDIADRRFESKWQKGDYVGISMEYTEDGIFMKPGVKALVGREAIAGEFKKSVAGIAKVEFFQDELEFYGDLTSAYQRAHMKGYAKVGEPHVFEGSYIIYWKKVGGEWLIHYDMFNSDLPAQSKISYYGRDEISRDRLMEEAQLIYVADRRFESKWEKKDHVGISEEYTHDGVFMKPGTKPCKGRKAIANEFKKSVQGTDRVVFIQDELEFQEGLTSAFQRAHMKGYVNGTEDPVFHGSYTILWKKVNGEWLIHYDMFNSDN